MLVCENRISVAISNPPKRNNPTFESNKAEGPNENAKSLGSGSFKTYKTLASTLGHIRL